MRKPMWIAVVIALAVIILIAAGLFVMRSMLICCALPPNMTETAVYMQTVQSSPEVTEANLNP